MTHFMTIGARVRCYQIQSVSWPGESTGEPVSGVVTQVDVYDGSFRFLPDLPDLTSNQYTNGHNFNINSGDQLGWYVNMASRWELIDYVIEELILG